MRRVTGKELIHSMSRYKKLPLTMLLALTTLPALMIGTVLWFVADIFPACTITEQSRLAAPDGAFDLVTFSRVCGEDTPPNTQAALLPPGATVPDDVASFVSVGASTDFAPRWTAGQALELSLPADAQIFRNDDTVAGVAVTYR